MLRDTLDVDRDALKRLIEWHIEKGSNALVAVGTTGESQLSVSMSTAV